MSCPRGPASPFAIAIAPVGAASGLLVAGPAPAQGKDSSLRNFGAAVFQAFGPTVYVGKDIGVWGTMLEGRVQPLPRAAKAVASLTSATVAGSDAVADRAMTDMLAARLVTLLNHAHGVELRFR